MKRLLLSTFSVAAGFTQGANAQTTSGNSLRPHGAADSPIVSEALGPAIDRADGQSAPQLSSVALDGFCAVSLLENRSWVVGSTEHQALFDGKTYRFAGAEALAAFQANPAKYASALGGDDVVTYVRIGQRVAGKLVYGARHLDRHYFFASEANKAAFTADPLSYAQADLAMGGACPVSWVDRKASVGGSPEVTVTYDGLRYRFTGAQELQTFMADPNRYAVPNPSPNGSR